MDRSRVIVLGVAGLAAIVAALLVRSLIGGGTEKSAAATAPRPAATVQVLVAARDISPGKEITPQSVKWQVWPKSAVSSGFITASGNAGIAGIVKGTVARAPLIAGEPLSTTKIVHAESAGFMAAQLQDGMRAISIAISDHTGAGGFVLPNDRVDVLVTHGNARSGASAKTILRDVRVLAIGQTSQQQKDEKVVTGKTATLEVSPADAEVLARASVAGALSLSLRPLIDGNKSALAANEGPVAVVRYGLTRGGNAQPEE